MCRGKKNILVTLNYTAKKIFQINAAHRSREKISCTQSMVSQWVNVATHKIRGRPQGRSPQAWRLSPFSGRELLSLDLERIPFLSVVLKTTFAVWWITLAEVCKCVWAAACLLVNKSSLYMMGHHSPLHLPTPLPHASMGHCVLCL